ncbi:MAG TPA: hypothetical protein VMW41_02390 [Candidatus Bathyarchaeia archaeon]|nr:hypothetical protein [Candidatus Bathyarchaeia archaeon]
MDNAQAFAEQAHIVTPYSALIALINQQQMEELRRQSESERRYQESPVVSQPAPEEGWFNLSPTDQFAPLSGRGILNPFGVQILNLDSSREKAPGVYGGFSGSAFSFFPLGNLFIIANILLLVIGTTAYLVISIRKTKKTPKAQ